MSATQSIKENVNIVKKASSEIIYSDLDGLPINGVIYWRGIPLEHFNKDQLIKIIYLLVEND